MSIFQNLRTKIYADGADIPGMLELNRNPLIQGMTTNPTLMKQSGITDYEGFAREVLGAIKTKPISFEVFADEPGEMQRQAVQIASWQENVYVKIPVLTPAGEPTTALIRELAAEGVKLNITAIMTEKQIEEVAGALLPEVASIISIFAGRIADTGRDPAPIFTAASKYIAHLPQCETLWASVREVLNIFQADALGAHIVTVPHPILRKAIEMAGRDLDELSLDTVRMFDQDAKSAGYTMNPPISTAIFAL